MPRHCSDEGLSTAYTCSWRSAITGTGNCKRWVLWKYHQFPAQTPWSAGRPDLPDHPFHLCSNQEFRENSKSKKTKQKKKAKASNPFSHAAYPVLHKPQLPLLCQTAGNSQFQHNSPFPHHLHLLHPLGLPRADFSKITEATEVQIFVPALPLATMKNLKKKNKLKTHKSKNKLRKKILGGGIIPLEIPVLFQTSLLDFTPCWSLHTWPS